MGLHPAKQDGPVVVEVPPAVPGASFFGTIEDAWYVALVDIGFEGKGGKYLVLPPDYTGDVPAALPSCLRASWDSVVSMTIGIPLHAGLARSLRMRPMPSRFGMLRSVITRFTGLVSLASASLPSTASITV